MAKVQPHLKAPLKGTANRRPSRTKRQQTRHDPRRSNQSQASRGTSTEPLDAANALSIERAGFNGGRADLGALLERPDGAELRGDLGHDLVVEGLELLGWDERVGGGGAAFEGLDVCGGVGDGGSGVEVGDEVREGEAGEGEEDGE